MGKKLPHHKQQDFSTEQVAVKHNIKRNRIEQGYSMYKFATAIGVSRKQLEDIETTRTTYGCYIKWDIACKCADVLGITLNDLRSGA